MAVVYHEDLAKENENYNKYLAVNLIATRARELNAQGLPSSSSGVRQKLVVVATHELIAGKIKFEKSEAKPQATGISSIFDDAPLAPDDDDWRDEGGIFKEDYLAAEEPEEVEIEEGL